MTEKLHIRRGRPLKGASKAVGMNISLSIETREKLEAESERTGLPMAEIIRLALEGYLR